MKRWAVLALFSWVLLLTACQPEQRDRIRILPVVAQLGYGSAEAVRFPLVTVVLPGGTAPAVTQCSLLTRTGEAVDCEMDSPPAKAGLGAWYLTLKPQPGTYDFTSVRLTTVGGGAYTYALGDLTVRVVPVRQPAALRAGSFVTQASTVSAYSVEVVNTGDTSVQIEGVDGTAAPFRSSTTLVAPSIESQPAQYIRAEGDVAVAPSQRKAFRFEYDSPKELGVAPPYYMNKPLLRYRTAGETEFLPLQLTSYIPSLPMSELFAYLEENRIGIPVRP